MERTIRVTGKGKISVSPDTIKLNISAEGVFKDYAETVSKASEETSLIKEAISNAGLDPKDLKTSHFGVDTEYERYRDKRDDWRRKFVGYKYQHRLNVCYCFGYKFVRFVELWNCRVYKICSNSR